MQIQKVGETQTPQTGVGGLACLLFSRLPLLQWLFEEGHAAHWATAQQTGLVSVGAFVARACGAHAWFDLPLSTLLLAASAPLDAVSWDIASFEKNVTVTWLVFVTNGHWSL
jgi:hypothetical protein